MPRESIQIPLDKIGIITNIDAKDIPEHYLTDSLNLDPDAPVGTVKSIKDLGSDLAYTNINSSTIARTFITSAGKTNIYTDKGKLEDLYIASPGVPTTTAHTTPLNITDISVNNAELRVCLSDADTANRFVGYNKGKRLGGIWYFMAYESKITPIDWKEYKLGADTAEVNAGQKFIPYIYGHYTGSAASVNVYYMFDVAGLILKVTLVDPAIAGAGDWTTLTLDHCKNGLDLGDGLETKPAYISNGLLPTILGGSSGFTNMYFKVTVYMNNNDEDIMDVSTELLPPNINSDYTALQTEAWIGFAQGAFSGGSGDEWVGIGEIWGSDQPIDKDSYYRYKYSLIYDGVQESPLSVEYKEVILNAYSANLENTNLYQIRIDCLPVHNFYSTVTTVEIPFRDRVTGVKLYRSRRHQDDALWSAYYEVGEVDLLQSPSGFYYGDSQTEESVVMRVYKLSQLNSNNVIEYNDDFGTSDYNKSYYGWGSLEAYDTGNGDTQSVIHCMFVDNNTLGPSYEENTGYSEDIETTRLDYQLTEIFNGANYVSRIKDNTDLTVDGQFAIIKSKDGCLDMFNYFDNIMRLPEPPLQLKAFNNRLYAFGVNTLYIINPNLFIEDTLEGIGISKRTGYQFGIEPIVTDSGMFWTDDRGAYWHNGKEIIEITDVIKDTFNKTSGSGLYGYNASTATYKSIAYNTGKKCIIFGYYISPHYYMFVFHIPTKQWFKWSFSIHSNGYLFSGNQNDTYLIATYNSSTPVIKKLFAGTGYMAGTLTSKEYGQDLQYKKWYKFNMEENTVAGLTVTKEVSFDDASLSAITTSDLNKQKKKKMYFKLSWAANNGEKIIKAIEIIFRKLIGYR